jgi:hypothetical protein
MSDTTEIFGIAFLAVVGLYCLGVVSIRLVLWASDAFDNSIPEEKDLWQDVDKTDTH